MQYRKDKYGNDISMLGFGCMRFPRKNKVIDMEETEKEILHAIEWGINYFDTAYIYPGSEAALGEILEKNNIRDKVYIATKLPHYLIKSREALEKLFQEQLRRLKTCFGIWEALLMRGPSIPMGIPAVGYPELLTMPVSV